MKSEIIRASGEMSGSESHVRSKEKNPRGWTMLLARRRGRDIWKYREASIHGANGVVVPVRWIFEVEPPPSLWLLFCVDAAALFAFTDHIGHVDGWPDFKRPRLDA